MENKIIQYLSILWSKTIAPSLQSFFSSNVRAINDAKTSIVESQKETRDAIKSIPIVDIPKIDLSLLEGKLDMLLNAFQSKEMIVNIKEKDVNIDTTSIVKAIEKMHKSIPSMSQKEQIDYTMMIDDMCRIMEKPDDNTELIKLQQLVSKLATSDDILSVSDLLSVIALKENNEFPDLKVDKEGRILVSVDRVGGYSGGLTSVENSALLNVATEKTMKEILAVLIQIRDGGYVPPTPTGGVGSWAIDTDFIIQ